MNKIDQNNERNTNGKLSTWCNYRQRHRHRRQHQRNDVTETFRQNTNTAAAATNSRSLAVNHRTINDSNMK